MEDAIKGMREVVTTLAVQKERLDTQGQRLNVLDARVEDLRNGRGYITDRSVRGVDREY